MESMVLSSPFAPFFPVNQCGFKPFAQLQLQNVKSNYRSIGWAFFVQSVFQQHHLVYTLQNHKTSTLIKTNRFYNRFSLLLKCGTTFKIQLKMQSAHNAFGLLHPKKKLIYEFLKWEPKKDHTRTHSVVRCFVCRANIWF